MKALATDRIYFFEHILGCKLEKYEIEIMRGLLEDRPKKVRAAAPKNCETRGILPSYIVIDEFPLDLRPPLE